MRRIFVSALADLAAPLSAQSLLYRSPNLSGSWVPEAGVLQFNFLHRFYVSPGNAKSVTNFPTFTLAVGLPGHTALGLHYATRSELSSTFSNEVELYARWRRQAGPIAVSVTPAYNLAAKSLDGEVGVDWTRGPLTLLAAARGMAHAYRVDTARLALAGGVVLRLNAYVGLTADAASLLAKRPGEQVAWSAGIVFAIPNSPHTFSLHASNADVNSIEGASRRSPLLAGFTKKPLYGFEFTIPLHLSRFGAWFHRSQSAAVAGDASAPVGATITIAAMKFPADTIVITAGQAVRWNNTDPLGHTITFDGGEPGSALINPGSAFVHRFDRPGTYAYHCTPHPFMKGVIVVR